MPLWKRRWAAATRDFAESVQWWRLWMTLGTNDVAQRYRRSKLGQFWITISMAVFIAGVGSIYAILFRSELKDHIPHVVVYYTAWSFVSQSVNEGVSSFTDAERYLRQERLPKLAFIFRVVWRNVLAYLHNLILIPIALFALGVTLQWSALISLIGAAFLLINVTLVAVILAVLCTRFRDLRQAVQSVVQMAFFASPIMWRPSILPADAQFVVDFNPVASHLRLVGDPLLGEAVPAFVYFQCAVCSLVLATIAIPLFTRFRERLVYWL